MLPSLHEGFGLPALEAMSVGTPVVASAVGALPELVADAGLLVDPHDSTTLAHAIRQIVTDDELHTRLAEAGTRRAASFCWRETVRQTAECYRRAVS